MDKLIENKEFVKDEQRIQNEIYNCLEKNQSFVFKAGAGSGKTYALVKSLEYLVDKYYDQLKYNSQKIACITYTNVAANNIKDRIGKTNIITVSTIHNLIWDIISSQQELLVNENEIEIKAQLSSEKIELEDLFVEKKVIEDEKIRILNFIESEEGDQFYKNFKNKNANEFNKEIIKHGIVEKKTFMMKAFKLVHKINGFNNYLNDTSHKEIIYNTFSNFDYLSKGFISHDTLLKYFYEIIRKSNILKQVLIDQFPIFLVDEYQDTNANVIKILSMLYEYALDNKRRFVVGYFGDEMQNIYNTGIGKNINEYHENLKLIEKKYNRRSFNEIINVSNKIRNDGLIQMSIYNNADGAIVRCYKGNENDFHDLINDMKEKLIDKNENLVCFVAVNKDVANYNGFLDLYNYFSKCPYYKRNYFLLNNDLITKDTSKLGITQLFIFKIIDLFIKFNETKTLISDLEFVDNISIEKMKKDIGKFNLSKIKTLNDMFNVMIKDYFKNDDFNLNSKKSLFSGSVPDSVNDIYEYLNNNLFDPTEEQTNLNLENNLNVLLNIGIEELKKWYHYVNDDQDQPVLYRTLHSTKGLEFDNVLIVLEDKFGKEKAYFQSLFENIEDESLNQEARNLLYVAVTRAKKNITLYYIKPSSKTEEGLKYLFGKVEPYSKDSKNKDFLL